jgi:hypothetical protein
MHRAKHVCNKDRQKDLSFCLTGFVRFASRTRGPTKKKKVKKTMPNSYRRIAKFAFTFGLFSSFSQ